MNRLNKIITVLLIIATLCTFSSCTSQNNELNFDCDLKKFNSVFQTKEMSVFTSSAFEYFNLAIDLKNCIINDKYLKHLDEYEEYSKMEELSDKLGEQNNNRYKANLCVYISSIQYYYAAINTNIPFNSDRITIGSDNYTEKIENDLLNIDEKLQQAYNFLIEANFDE